MQCGEQALLPAVREADASTLIVANGFSCKTQIQQCDTGRRALHVAQVMKLAREHGRNGPPGTYPERDGGARPTSARRRLTRLAAGASAAAVATAGAALALRRLRS